MGGLAHKSLICKSFELSKCLGSSHTVVLFLLIFPDDCLPMINDGL